MYIKVYKIALVTYVCIRYLSPGSIFCGILSQETHARRSLVKLQWKTLGFTISQIFWTFKKAPAQIKSVKRGMGVGGDCLLGMLTALAIHHVEQEDVVQEEHGLSHDKDLMDKAVPILCMGCPSCCCL